MSEQTEEEYLIERLSKLLAEISVIVNGPQPMGVLWSYADLPQKVQALKDAAALNAQAGVVEATEEAIEEAYWEFDARKRGVGQWKDCPQSERDAFKWAVRVMLAAAAPQPQASPQASAEDIENMDSLINSGEALDHEYDSWQRVRADYVAWGVVK